MFKSAMAPALVLICLLAPAAATAETAAGVPFRGVFFNPRVDPDPNFPWLLHYAPHREAVRKHLKELADTTGMNLVDIFVLIPHSLAKPAQGNQCGQALADWANLAYLDNVAAFVDDCHAAGLQVEIDLADNRWIPHAIDSENHIGRPDSPWWPTADGTPWDEAAEWYRQIIEYVEAHANHPENIALWCMGGNYHWGGAEPVLWDTDGRPAIKAYTENFVKHVWPVFRAAGKRPKGAPYLLPIFSANDYWTARSPEDRLSGVANLKRWLVDDLQAPPDYWPISTYPFCDPAPDGFHYLRRVVEILGKENASRIISTDFKGPGHVLKECIIANEGVAGPGIFQWHFDKCAAYGFAGWWIWAYQDVPAASSGIRRIDGAWKQDLVAVIKRQE